MILFAVASPIPGREISSVFDAEFKSISSEGLRLLFTRDELGAVPEPWPHAIRIKTALS